VPMQAMAFTLDEVAQARLAPLVNFRGRQAAPTAEPSAEGAEGL
jgi:ribosome maturation factor RimP